MKSLICFLGCFICFNSCQDNNNKLSVFVGFIPICQNYNINICINDSLFYEEEILGVNLGREYFPVLQTNKTDSIMKFQIQINEYDTTFIYNISDVDSMLIGLYFDPSNIDHQRASDLFYSKIKSDSLQLGRHDGFFIFTEHDPYVWLSEWLNFSASSVSHSALHLARSN